MNNLEKLANVLVDFINEDGPWTEKKAAVLAMAKDDEHFSVALEEFVSWLEGETL